MRFSFVPPLLFWCSAHLLRRTRKKKHERIFALQARIWLRNVTRVTRGLHQLSRLQKIWDAVQFDEHIYRRTRQSMKVKRNEDWMLSGTAFYFQHFSLPRGKARSPLPSSKAPRRPWSHFVWCLRSFVCSSSQVWWDAFLLRSFPKRYLHITMLDETFLRRLKSNTSRTSLCVLARVGWFNACYCVPEWISSYMTDLWVEESQQEGCCITGFVTFVIRSICRDTILLSW